MTLDEYQIEARKTQNERLPLWAMREHALYGLSSEVGEVLGLHQKVHQGHKMDEDALKHEIGDCFWFLAELCDVYGWSMDDVAVANIVKLRKRYKGGFTVNESVNRMEYRDRHVRQRARYYAKGEGKRG